MRPQAWPLCAPTYPSNNSVLDNAVMSEDYGGTYYAMPGSLPVRLRSEGIAAAAEHSRFLARMARPAVTDMSS